MAVNVPGSTAYGNDVVRKLDIARMTDRGFVELLEASAAFLRAWPVHEPDRADELLGHGQRLRQLHSIAISAVVLSAATPRSNRFG